MYCRRKTKLPVERVCILHEDFPEIILLVDQDGNIVRANKTASQIYGYSNQELCNMTIKELASNGEENLEFVGETLHRRKDGTRIPVEIQSQPMDSCQKKLILLLIRDVSKQKEAEHKAQVHEKNLQSIFDNIPVGIAISDGTGRVVRCNRALEEMLGYSEAELQQMPWQEYTHPEDVKANQDVVELLFAGDITDYSIKKRYLNKEGNTVWADVRGVKFYSPSGELQRLVVMEDITERRKMEQFFQDLNDCINVALYSKQSVLMEGLRYILQTTKGVNFIGQAHSFEDCYNLLSLNNVEILLIDEKILGQNLQEQWKILKNSFPYVELVLLASADTGGLASEKLPYLRLQDCTQEELYLKIKNILRASDDIATNAPLNMEKSVYDLLTTKEKRILYLVACGKTNKEIGEELFLSPSTIRNYVSTVLRKLNIPNRAAAAALFSKYIQLKD